jgi:spoIIIJ-associated protein
MEQVSSNKVVTFEAKTLEAVYEKASQSLNCSITNLEIVVKQLPSKGLFGFFIKNAIITAQIKSLDSNKLTSSHKEVIKNNEIETLTSKLNALNAEENKKQKKSIPKMTDQIKKENLFDDFYISKEDETHFTPIIKSDNKNLEARIGLEINNLFSKLCYDIDTILVKIMDDDKTVYIEFSGADSALLIGKEGYRYKALSYVLFNWINEKYDMMLRLEVAQFLSNQEDSIVAYLEPVIETIKKEGYFKTKILDGILVHITLTKLREEFPEKYVAVKTTQKGEKYILVNEYRN